MGREKWNDLVEKEDRGWWKVLVMVLNWLVLSAMVFVLYELFWFVVGGCEADSFFEDSWMFLGIDALVCLFFILVSLVCMHGMIFWLRHKTRFSARTKILGVNFGLLAFNFVCAWGVAFLLQRLYGQYGVECCWHGRMLDVYLLGVVCALVTALYLISYYSNRWVDEHLQYKRMALRSLQAQIEPHFVFNNLGALSGLLGEDTRRANDFLLTLIQVYRDTLLNLDNPVISIREELEQFRAYLKLMTIRFQGAFTVEIAPGLEEQDFGVSPGALTVLFENCIKHNKLDRLNPLRIEILFDDNDLIVRNEQRPIDSMWESTKMGNRNLRTRYAIISNLPVRTQPEDGYYVVYLPRLNYEP